MAAGGNEGGELLTLSFSADQNGAPYERPSIVVIDSHSLSRSCLARVLRCEFEDFAIIEIESMHQMDIISGKNVSLAAFNIGSRLIADEDVLRKLTVFRGFLAETPVVLLTQTDESTIADAMICEVTRFGVRGYVTDSASIEIALAALRLVIAGGIYFPRSVSEYANGTSVPAIGDVTLQAQVPPSGIGKANVAFTERERQVLASLLRGLSNKVIAGELNLSQNTVKSHISRIMHKLHAKNWTEAVVLSQHSTVNGANGRPHGDLGAPLDGAYQRDVSHA